MKIFAIKEESSDNSETVVYGWLTYFEEEKEFQIRLCEEIDYWECPIFFSPFVKKGEYVLNVHWSRAWVQQRILPGERQNLQMILQKNQMEAYDEYVLLVWTKGCCGQDGCYLELQN